MNIPKLRFKEFNDEWNYNSLSNYVERIITKNKNNESNLVLTISAQYGLVDQVKFFNRKVSSSNISGYYLLNNGDFAYNKSYSNGYPWGAIKRLNNYNQGVVSSLYICFRPKNNIDSDYLEQYFETNKWYRQVSEISVEGARNHGLLNIAVNDFFETKHYIPSIMEQAKIGQTLQLLDKKIELQTKKIEALKLFKSSQICTILNKLEHKNVFLKNLGYFISGNPIGKDKITDKGIPVILYGDLYTKYEEEINDVNQYVKENKKYIKSEKGDLIFPTSTTVDAISLISPSVINISDVVYGGDLIVFKINKAIVNPKFLSYQINHLKKKEFSKKAQGSTIIHIHADDLLNSTVEIPIMKYQKIISNFGSAINKKIELEKNKLDKLKLLKIGLLQNMFI